jgi:hypothetical protein
MGNEERVIDRVIDRWRGESGVLYADSKFNRPAYVSGERTEYGGHGGDNLDLVDHLRHS